MHLLVRRLASALLAVASVASYAQAAPESDPQHRAPQTLVREAKPGGAFGFWGPDVFIDQSVAQRFTVPADTDYRLLRVGLWLMNNSDSEHPSLRLSVQTDALDEGGFDTLPSGHELEAWPMKVEALGWVPMEQFKHTVEAPRLLAGHNYWVVASSHAAAGQDPIWVYAKRGTEVTTQSSGGVWFPGAETGALTMRVDALPVAH